ncbi:ABC transporter ATP-binding protein [Enterococcus casseliflavus]|uniref:ABC transporter ATP-binding protein n=1 Tax=Enterococcus casseliflavus TaxID=37734 RepID=UPI0018833766|nr:ABC transporter ATP-binding protein [Enterococcus casseliflavus]MBE9908976.1 ABC transporter ATP-binding protein [Enterococcus casseliflavus]
MNTISMKQFIAILNRYKPSWIELVGTGLVSILETGVSLIVPLLAMNLINLLIAGDLNWIVLLAIFFLFLIQIIFSGLSLYMKTYVGEKLIIELRKDLWSRVVNFPVSYFDRSNSGEVMSRITNDTTVLKNFLVDHLIPFFTGLITIIGSYIILFVINWRIAVLFLCVLPLAFLIISPLGKKMYEVARSTQNETAAFQGDLGRVLSNIRLVKISVTEKEEIDNGFKRMDSLYQYGLKAGKIMAVVSPIMTTTVLIVLLGILAVGIYQVATGALTGGGLIAIVFYLFQIMTPMTLMAQFFTQIQKARGSVESIYSLLKENFEENNHEVKIPINDSGDTEIELSRVGFAYDNNRELLTEISFIAKRGQKTAIVGESGVGKTTIFSLLEQFYKISKGQIYHNGESIYNYRINEWREKISYVSQDTPIMEGTIYDNLVYGIKKKVSNQEVSEALAKANLSEFINGLPDGINTEVGERGVRLSGGQKQRISIARAILKDPSILLLDEATAHLDSEAEGLVQEAFNNIMENRTTIVIAHRLSTVMDSDNIIVLQDGVVSGQGSHMELYKENSLYKKLVDQQKISNTV